MPFTEEEIKDLSERLWNKRVIYISKGDPIIFRMHFDSAISIAFEMVNQRIAQLETYISDNLHKKAICDCGDSIEPDTGAVCGTCASIEQASQPQWIAVSETRPPKKTTVVVFHEGEAKTAYIDQYGEALGDNYATESESAPAYRCFTHWMPLPPDPPKSS